MEHYHSKVYQTYERSYILLPLGRRKPQICSLTLNWSVMSTAAWPPIQIYWKRNVHNLQSGSAIQYQVFLKEIGVMIKCGEAGLRSWI